MWELHEKMMLLVKQEPSRLWSSPHDSTCPSTSPPRQPKSLVRPFVQFLTVLVVTGNHRMTGLYVLMVYQVAVPSVYGWKQALCLLTLAYNRSGSCFLCSYKPQTKRKLWGWRTAKLEILRDSRECLWMICGEFANHSIASVAGPLPISLLFSLTLLSGHINRSPYSMTEAALGQVSVKRMKLQRFSLP